MAFKFLKIIFSLAKLNACLICWLHEPVRIIAWHIKDVGELGGSEEIERLESVLCTLLLESSVLLLLASSIEEGVLAVLLIQSLAVLALDIEILIGSDRMIRLELGVSILLLLHFGNYLVQPLDFSIFGRLVAD